MSSWCQVFFLKRKKSITVKKNHWKTSFLPQVGPNYRLDKTIIHIFSLNQLTFFTSVWILKTWLDSTQGFAILSCCSVFYAILSKHFKFSIVCIFFPLNICRLNKSFGHLWKIQLSRLSGVANFYFAFICGFRLCSYFFLVYVNEIQPALAWHNLSHWFHILYSSEKRQVLSWMFDLVFCLSLS